jgi:hypothetical protein
MGGNSTFGIMVPYPSVLYAPVLASPWSMNGPMMIIMNIYHIPHCV